MAKPKVTCDQSAAVARMLRTAAGPLTAIRIARCLCLEGARETQRRHVRAIIKNLRDRGSWIVATNQAGYMLTDDESIWRDYQDGRQIDAKRVMAVTGKRKRMLADSKGQGFLFRAG